MSWGPGSPLGWASFFVGRGMAWRLGGGGGEGLPRQKGSSLPWTEEVGGGVPGSKTGGLEAGVRLSQDSPGALGVFLQHRTRCNFSEDTGKDPSVQPDSW